MSPLLEQISKRKAQQEKLLEELSQHRQMMVEAAQQDSEYVRLKEIATRATKEARLQLECVLSEPEHQSVIREIAEVKRVLKDLNAVLTGELYGYARAEDSFSIELEGEQLYNIQLKAKLVKTNQPTLI